MSKQDFIDGYIDCALWASDDDHGRQLDAGYYGLSVVTRSNMESDAAEFFREHAALINDMPEGYTHAQAGHDFWLTRCGHGAGFWDRDGGDVGDRLTELAEAEGGRDLYVGDDGLIYQSEA